MGQSDQTRKPENPANPSQAPWMNESRLDEADEPMGATGVFSLPTAGQLSKDEPLFSGLNSLEPIASRHEGLPKPAVEPGYANDFFRRPDPVKPAERLTVPPPPPPVPRASWTDVQSTPAASPASPMMASPQSTPLAPSIPSVQATNWNPASLPSGKAISEPLVHRIVFDTPGVEPVRNEIAGQSGTSSGRPGAAANVQAAGSSLNADANRPSELNPANPELNAGFTQLLRSLTEKPGKAAGRPEVERPAAAQQWEPETTQSPTSQPEQRLAEQFSPDSGRFIPDSKVQSQTPALAPPAPQVVSIPMPGTPRASQQSGPVTSNDTGFTSLLKTLGSAGTNAESTPVRTDGTPPVAFVMSGATSPAAPVTRVEQQWNASSRNDLPGNDLRGSNLAQSEPSRNMPLSAGPSAPEAGGFTALLRGVSGDVREPIGSVEPVSGSGFTPRSLPDLSPRPKFAETLSPLPGSVQSASTKSAPPSPDNSFKPSSEPGELTQLFSAYSKPAESGSTRGGEFSDGSGLNNSEAGSLTDFFRYPSGPASGQSSSPPSPAFQPSGGQDFRGSSVHLNDGLLDTRSFQGLDSSNRQGGFDQEIPTPYIAPQSSGQPIYQREEPKPVVDNSGFQNSNVGITQLLSFLDSPSTQPRPIEQRAPESSPSSQPGAFTQQYQMLSRQDEPRQASGSSAESKPAYPPGGLAQTWEPQQASEPYAGGLGAVSGDVGESEYTKIFNASKIREVQRGGQVTSPKESGEAGAASSPGESAAGMQGWSPKMPGTPAVPQGGQMPKMPQFPGGGGQMPGGGASSAGQSHGGGFAPPHMPVSPQIAQMKVPEIKAPEMKVPQAPAAPQVGKLQQMMPILLICVIFLLVVILVTLIFLLKH